MFCPRCGTNQSEEFRFCKLCGANLQAVRRAVATREPGEKADRGTGWVAETPPGEVERVGGGQEIEHECGVPPEVKRYNEIKSGVITSCVGLGVSIFLFFFMQGVILSGQNPPGEAEIIGRLWIVGVIPFLIGIGLIINGVFVGKKLVEAAAKESPREAATAALVGTPAQAEHRALGPADTTQFIPQDFSVTENTTRHLSGSGRKE